MIILMSIIIKRTDTCKLEILGLVSKLRRVDSVILMIFVNIIMLALMLMTMLVIMIMMMSMVWIMLTQLS